MNVRLAEIQDFPEVCRMAQAFHACTEYRHIPFDDASCYLLFKSAMEKQTCLVAESESVVGFILGLPCPCPFNQMVTMASEMAWWVDPEYRNTSAGIKLLKGLEGAMGRYGAEFLTMVCLESMEPDKIQHIYQRMGYRQTERAFTRDLRVH